MFHQMPALLALLIFIIIAFGGYIPLQLAEILFGVSLTIKSIIIFLLPVIIFSLLYKAAANLAKDASRIILVILGGVIISNFLTTSLSQVIGIIIYGFDLSLAIPNENDALKGHILFALPNLIPNHYAMFSGIIMGILSARIIPKKTENICLLLEAMTTKLLKIITFMIPLFVTGFVVKLQYDGVITQILKNYTMIFMIIAFRQFGYVTFVYFVLEKFNISSSVISIKNMLPAALSGFSTMSSAASMPLTIIGTEKNAQNKDLVHTVIPATVNIHLVGDCIAIPCFAYAILKNYNLPQPDITTYIIFTFYFVLAKFSVAAIPGGGILVMLPILDKYLGFNTEMLSLITALYILFDPFITSANVLGNGAFARIIDKLDLKKTTLRTQ
ncbi:MAG: cation:dicarboxylase symporter family transporter [Rickettsiaceae bacterium]|nr:cation:dicarboxylase symporter family transporter [Rickettsiaceae bacterium]